MGEPEDRCRLYLAVPAGPGSTDRLAAALDAAPVASVLVRPATGGRLDIDATRRLVEIAQRTGAAALIEADAGLARTLRADGVHLPWSADGLEAYRAARAVLGERCIIGADAGASRHDAMSLGEAGAEYIGFDCAAGTDEELERLAWWAEIFQPPCVAFGAGDPEAARTLAETGADFVAIALPAAQPISDTAALIRAIASAIGLAPGQRGDRQ